jgi:hypothetical protein
MNPRNPQLTFPALSARGATRDAYFTKTKLIFNRIILEGGKQVDPKTGVEVSE